MDYLIVFFGLFLIGTAMTDALITTLVPSGGGPVTSFLSERIWRLLLRFHKPGQRRSHRMLRAAGPIILIIVFLVWVVLLWSGWTLVFTADTSAVLDIQTQEPVDIWGRIYFAGYTIFTLGIGNHIPAAGPWQVVTVLASLNGLFLVTLSITYLLPIVSAATQMQQLAALVSGLGHTPYDMLKNAWNGDDFSSFDDFASTVIPPLELHTQRHNAYPVLHYFHSADRRTSIGISIAALDEALFILQEGVVKEKRPIGPGIESLAETVQALLSTIRRNYGHMVPDPPAAPSLEPLRKIGIPTVSDAEFERAAQSRADHRKHLRGYVHDEGWDWDSIAPGSDSYLRMK